MKPFAFALTMVEVVLVVLAIRTGVGQQQASRPGCAENELVSSACATGGAESTAVAVSDDRRVFVSFPARTPEVDGALAEVKPDGSIVPYPDQEWNAWGLKPGQEATRHFVCVQSLVCDDRGGLWALDSGRLDGAGVNGGAKLVRIDLETDRVERVYAFRNEAMWRDAKLNAVRIDAVNHAAYITDAASGSLLRLDLATGRAHRLAAGGSADTAAE